MVGSDKERFKDLADETNLPEERQETCRRDYQNASWSWERSLQPHHRSPEQAKQKIETTYWPGKGNFEIYEQTFRTIRLLEMVANHASEAYVWPHPLSFEMATCGESAAQWQTSTRKLFLCYELAQEFAQLYRDYGQEWKAPPMGKWWQSKWWKHVKGG
jgi:Putative metallopeptidase